MPVWRVRGYVLDIMHLLAVGVAETSELQVIWRGAYTFGHVVYV